MSDSHPSRNAPCPCGSGKRYKHCHGRAAAEAAQGPVADAAEALFRTGNEAHAHGRHAEAVELFERALQRAPAHAGLLNNLGLALEAAGRVADAQSRFRAAVALAPAAFEPLANLAQNLYRQKRYGSALAQFDALCARFEVQAASIHANRGVCQLQAGDVDAAERSLRAALALERRSANLYCDIGFLYTRQKRFAEAAAAFERALALEPDLALAASWLLFCRQNVADWRDFDALRARVLANARTMESHAAQSSSPFNLQTICDDPALQRIAARSSMRNHLVAYPAKPARPHAGPLRLGFVSFDVYDHPVGRLIVDLVERLDRARFEVTVYALGAAREEDPIRRRLRAAASAWRDSATLNADQLADTIRLDRIDVLFDLAGFTGWPLVDVFLRRPAPLQINFLGYTGTLGSPAYDCIVTDRHCIDAAAATHYVERPLYVGPCYLPSDSKRALDPTPIARAQYALPDGAFVLCAFGATYKILPEVFAGWMSLLARHPRCVLWLRAGGSEIDTRLRAAAQAHGVDPDRLVFAPTEPAPRYLARFRLADVFLDTVPFGSHTSVNDALYAGLPVLTVNGASFAGRASASQVLAAGLPQLVARDLDDYRHIAARMIDEPATLRALTAQLGARPAPLFDMARYAERFGAAVQAAWQERCAPL